VKFVVHPLIQGKHLDNLKYIGREHDGEKLYNKDLNIYFAETFILIQSNKDTLKCKLGEMFKINGKWKSFTHPKFRLVKSH